MRRHSVGFMNPNKGYKATDMLMGEQGTKAIIRKQQLLVLSSEEAKGVNLAEQSQFHWQENFQTPSFLLFTSYWQTPGEPRCPMLHIVDCCQHRATFKWTYKY